MKLDFLSLSKISTICKEKSIRGYCACIVNSGFGDIITNAAVSSVLPSLLGLEFRGITSKNAYYDDKLNTTIVLEFTGHHGYYAEFLSPHFTRFTKDEVFIVKVNNIWIELESIIKQLSKAPPKSIICIAPTALFSMGMNDEVFPQLKINLYDNEFIRILQDSLKQRGFYDAIDYSSMCICIHQRMGDSAVIEINSSRDIVATDWIGREDKYKQYGWYNLKTQKGCKSVYKEYCKNHSLKSFIQNLKLIFPYSKIYFISDGFEQTYQGYESERNTLRIKHLSSLNIKYDSKVAREYGEKFINDIKSLKEVDKVIIGDNYTSFLECAKILLCSNLIFSNRRAYVLRNLLCFKTDKSFPQITCINGVNGGNIFFAKDKNIYNNLALRQQIENRENVNKNFLPIDGRYSLLNLISKSSISYLSATPCMQGSAKDRIHNHLAYKLGSAMILNSKSLWGYIRMPYVLSYIKESHKKEILDYETRITKNPSLKLPKLESYPDYKEALKEKQCFTYKLGLAFIKANKTWYKGGLFRFCFLDIPRLRRKLREKRR